MKKYNTIIFDLDDTLIDNTKASKYAFKCILEVLDISYKEDLFYKYLEFDAAYWHRWEYRQMEIPEHLYIRENIEELRTYLRAKRFAEFFNIKDFDFAVSINSIYCNNLGVDIESIEGSKEILEYLYNKYRLVIATNGPYNAAIDKINKAGIKEYFEKIYCSELIGFSKPNSNFWNSAFNDLKEKRNDAILIGDSLTTDIASGIKNNFDTVWYNPEKKVNRELKPTYEINHLFELKRRL